MAQFPARQAVKAAASEARDEFLSQVLTHYCFCLGYGVCHQELLCNLQNGELCLPSALCVANSSLSTLNHVPADNRDLSRPYANVVGHVADKIVGVAVDEEWEGCGGWCCCCCEELCKCCNKPRALLTFDLHGGSGTAPSDEEPPKGCFEACYAAIGMDVSNTIEMIIAKEDANTEFLHGYVYGALSAHGDQLHVRASLGHLSFAYFLVRLITYGFAWCR